MYSLEELFRNTKHSSYIFSPEEINAVEEAVVLKGSIPYIKCIIRKKDVKLTPEEAVRQLYVRRLINDYGYSEEQIRLEHPIHFGREVKRADIVIFEKDKPDAAYIIAEIKQPQLTDGKEQLRSYCNATGASIGVWTNGENVDCYYRTAPNILRGLWRIPKATEILHNVLAQEYTIKDLENDNKLKDGRKTLKSLILEMENEVLAAAGVNAFEEVFKLIYTKLYDELMSIRNESRPLEFRIYGGDDEEKADKLLAQRIQALFKLAKKKWEGVFDEKAVIELMPSHLAVCVSTLQEVKLFNSNLDVVDDAFEYLMNKSSKGEKGQFFTPRYVIDMCVKMLNPQPEEAMIDTAAGSCGFPVHTIFYVWGLIYDMLGIPRKNIFTAEDKPEECKDYVKDKVFAIDFDETAVRVARTLNLIAGDGKTNVMHLNTLDYLNWKTMTEAAQWMPKYHEGWYRFIKFRETEDSNKNFMFDIVMANPPFAGDIQQGKILSCYDLAKDAKGRTQKKVGRDILFIERNLEFLKPGGRMAIVLPQGRFNNSSDKYIRDFIAERCRILAVIGLHGNVFKPHTGTKTSVLLVQKWDDELCPQREDYPIFFATMRKPGKDNSGEKVYRKRPDGSIMLDGHNHPVVEHDLYNHEGLTEDGIAEAFIEFARREGLSFFVEAHSPERYAALMDGLECCEVNISYIRENTYDFRIESEFYKKGDIFILSKLKAMNSIMLKDGLAEFVTDGTHFTPDYVEEGIPFLSALNVKKGYLDVDVGYKYITTEEHEKLCRRVKPQAGDILLRKVGVGERLSCIVPPMDYEFSIFVSIALIRAKINPYYLSTFINTKYGQMQLLRFNKGISQPDLHLEDIQRLLVPVFSDDFYEYITNIMLQAQTLRDNAISIYKEAQDLLTDALNFDRSAISQANITLKSFSELSERWDAEYFMPKYDDILAGFSDAKTVDELCTIHKANFTPQAGTEYRYIELADIGTYGDITGATIADGADLPTRARRIVHTGQVIVSSIEGSMQSCALVTPEYDGALCSTGFYVVESNSYNPETLLMLFKSQPVQELMKRGCTGMILASISEKELKRVKLPYIDDTTQSTIASKIQQSFTLRRQSEDLIAQAIKSVELAIEQGEHEAFEFLCG